MTAATYDAAMVRVFADEGGYGNDPVDPGGATNLGITIIDARKYAAEFGWIVGREVTIADMKAMPKWFAEKVYRQKYADRVRYDDLPAGFDYSVLDAGINSGVGRAVPWAAKAIGIASKSLDDVVAQSNAEIDKVSLIQKYWALRLSFLHGLRTWGHFGPGWGKRCANGEAAAVRMWLSVGRGLSNDDAKARLNAEADKAKIKSTQATTGAASAGTATTAAPPTLDPSHLSLGGKIAFGIGIALAVAFVVYLIRQTIIHNQRAAAYAKA